MVKLKDIHLTSLVMMLFILTSPSHAEPPAGHDLNAADAAFSKGHYRRAAVHYQQLLRNEPDNPAYRMKLAESYEFSGKLEFAEDHARRVLENNGRNTEALLMMGRVRGRQEDWAGSKEFYEQAIKADKQNAPARLGLGQALMQLGDAQSAEAAFAEYRRLTGIPAP